MSYEKIEIIIKTIEDNLKELKKETKKYKKEKQEKQEKQKKQNKTNNGLNKEYVLSDDLCIFLNIKCGSKMARTNVTKEILKYIKEHKLGDKRNIKIDEKLKHIIQEEQITYFTLQKFMNKHYKYN
jgi:chromatin remodeling complex protein RSC6